MASGYPTSLDSLATTRQDDTDAKSGADLGLSTTTGVHAQDHNDLADAVNKIEAELGTAPSNSSATVRERFEEFNYKRTVDLATNAALAAVTYANGTAGVGATLTANANGVMAAVDGVTPTVGMRILVKDQAAPLQHGIYDVTSVGAAGAPFVLTRSVDANNAAKLSDMEASVAQGTANGDTKYRCSATAPTVGTTSLPWRRIMPFYGHGNPRFPWGVGGNTVQPIMETLPRFAATAALTLPTAATHTLYGGIVLPAGRTITNVNFVYTTAAATITIFYVSLIRLSDLSVLRTSANATGAWAAAPATKTVALASTITADYDTPVYVGIALAATTAAIIPASPAFANVNITNRPPILVGTTTTPTTTPITGTAAALTAIVGGIGYVWLT